jgi:hypothetical protein
VRRARTGIALVLVAAIAGCGSGGDHQARLTRVQAQALTAELEAVRISAAARNLDATKASLLRFRRSVARLQRDGALSAERARALRIGAARLLRRVESDNAPAPVQATPPATQTTPAPAPPGQKRKHEEKKKHGKGKGHGGDGEGGD